MRVMVIVKATAGSEAGEIPPEIMEAMGRFNAELKAAGVWIMGEGLRPSASAKRVTFDGEARRVEDGPFEPAGELAAGFWLWNVRDMDEAVAWVKRCPNPMRETSVIEIRPMYDLADLPA